MMAFDEVAGGGDSLAGLSWGEIVEHDAVYAADGEDLVEFVEIADLDFDFEILTFLLEVVVGSVDGLVDTSGEVDVIVLEENHIEEADAVVAAASDLDGHLVEQPHARRCLAGVDDLRVEALELGDVAGSRRCDAAHVLHDIEDEPLGEEEGLSATLDTEGDVSLLDAVSVVENLLEREAAVDMVENLTSDIDAREDTVLLNDKLRAAGGVGWDAGEGGMVSVADIFFYASVDEVVEVSVEICHFCSSILNCLICLEPLTD